MHYHRESSPVNLAFKHSENDKCKIASILPPYPESLDIKGYNMNDDNFENLKEFRSRILEMDEEINQFKNIEKNKQMLHHKNEDQSNDFQLNSNLNFKEEPMKTTESLLQEQRKRIAELERQFGELKADHLHLKHGRSVNENCQRKEKIEKDLSEHQRIDFEKELEERIYEKIGSWTPKDPYQGPMQNLYFPFGSSGGGAPRRDDHGRIQTTMVGSQNLNSSFEERKQKFLASQSIQESFQREMLQQRLRKLQDKQRIREPNGGFSDVIASFKGGKPKRDPATGMLIDNHLGSSDVTNMKLDSTRIPSPKVVKDNNRTMNSETKTYGMELIQAAKERQMMRYLDKLREQQESRQHMRVWNNIWGPRDQRNYNSNNQSSRTPSNHRNFYELTNTNI